MTITTLKKRMRAGLLALAMVTSAVAHEGMEDITGTIQSVSDNSVSVKTTKGKTVEVKLDAKTEYSRGKQQAKQADLKVGERVVVHAMEMDKKLTAHLVQLQTASSKKK